MVLVFEGMKEQVVTCEMVEKQEELETLEMVELGPIVYSPAYLHLLLAPAFWVHPLVALK
ncbi:hypothetical protein GOP47_0022019 [Adiantum capillus-veneris]|uniref:Uncharacterized protein n=1 Tax=Adiantum capillus-veneris TaxID=13818 RepID=A0A9D4Z7G3_ADICA|nr:hypothetical protein GOP47_0022019 [Adiantum capillus-veneris]